MQANKSVTSKTSHHTATFFEGDTRGIQTKYVRESETFQNIWDSTIIWEFEQHLRKIWMTHQGRKRILSIVLQTVSYLALLTDQAVMLSYIYLKKVKISSDFILKY